MRWRTARFIVNPDNEPVFASEFEMDSCLRNKLKRYVRKEERRRQSAAMRHFLVK